MNPISTDIIIRMEKVNQLMKSGLVTNPQDWFRILNLSQDEIDALVAETVELAKQMSGSLPIQTSFPWYISDPNIIIPSAEIKKECIHDWKVYLGLNESDTYCTKCNITK
jgi:hypothetical protein